MSRFLDSHLPPIDLHAHIAPDVTTEQLAQISPSVTFAVTRSLREADAVRSRTDDGVIWGCGVHPGVREALTDYDQAEFQRLLADFIFVGEVGLDARGGAAQLQRDVLESVLEVASTRNVIISLHSSGRSRQIVEFLERHQPAGAVLHWFTGDPDLVARAAAAGAYFSVNSSAKDELLRSLPHERVLTETDFPSTKRTGSRLPAHVEIIEARLATLWAEEPGDLRRCMWRNLRGLAQASRTLSRFPRSVAQTLIGA